MNRSFSVQADVDVVNGPSLHMSGLLHRKGFSAGVEALVNSHYDDKELSGSSSSGGAELADLNVGWAYNYPEWNVSMRTTGFLNNLRMSYVHHVSPELTVGTPVLADIADKG